MDQLTPEQKNLLTFSEALNAFTNFFKRIYRSSHFQFSHLYNSSADEQRSTILAQIDTFTFQERKVLHQLLVNSHKQLGILIDRLEDFMENDQRKIDEQEEK